MTRVNDMARDMRRHTVSGAGPARLVDFAIDFTGESLGGTIDVFATPEIAGDFEFSQVAWYLFGA